MRRTIRRQEHTTLSSGHMHIALILVSFLIPFPSKYTVAELRSDSLQKSLFFQLSPTTLIAGT